MVTLLNVFVLVPLLSAEESLAYTESDLIGRIGRVITSIPVDGAVEQAAEAEKNKQIAEADANKYRIEAMAKAEGERVRIDGTAKADAEKAQGETEAEVIRLKGLAEAKQKIAEAFEQYGQAAMLDMILKMLPEYAKQVATPLSNIDKITVVDTGGSGENSGANKITGYATNLMSTLQESLKASSGIDVKELIENFSGKVNVRQSIDSLANELKETKNIETKTNE